MAQDYSTTQAHNLFIFSYQTQSISFGHSSTYLSQADVSSQCSFRTNPFSCQHEQVEKPIQDQAMS